jgi:hypothetical protein
MQPECFFARQVDALATTVKQDISGSEGNIIDKVDSKIE